MQASTICIDLAKRVFQVHEVDQHGNQPGSHLAIQHLTPPPLLDRCMGKGTLPCNTTLSPGAWNKRAWPCGRAKRATATWEKASIAWALRQDS